MKPCILIPFYNHGGAIGGVVESLRSLGLPCFIVDDGSGARDQADLDRAIASEGSWITLQRLPLNQGKGGAVIAGCEAALAAGFTHALQIDADGQHQAADVPRLLEASQRQPQALVSGQAIYDESVPRARLYGRYLTHVWVWINTLSFEIKDSMCGLRVYPLEPTCAVWRGHYVGRRMDFDTEIMVRLSWRGVPIVSIPTRVTYPTDGVSHFRMLKDNVFISIMHARLFLRNGVALAADFRSKNGAQNAQGSCMTPARFQIEVPLTIPFHDVDMLGIAWHGHYAKYFEIARCALLDQLDYGYEAMRASGFLWPVIDLRVRYIKPVKFGQHVRVRATLREWENRLLIDYLLTDANDGHRLTKGTTSQVAVDVASGEMCFVSPPVLFERLGVEA